MKKMILNQPRGDRNGGVIANDDFKKQLLAALKLMEEGNFSARLPADLTGLDGIHVSCAEIWQLAVRRSAFNPNNIHVKSAFLATDPLAFGIARMYEQLLNSPRIEVRVWGDLQAAADWLGVTPDKLTF